MGILGLYATLGLILDIYTDIRTMHFCQDDAAADAVYKSIFWNLMLIKLPAMLFLIQTTIIFLMK